MFCATMWGRESAAVGRHLNHTRGRKTQQSLKATKYENCVEAIGTIIPFLPSFPKGLFTQIESNKYLSPVSYVLTIAKDTEPGRDKTWYDEVYELCGPSTCIRIPTLSIPGCGPQANYSALWFCFPYLENTPQGM